MNIEKLVEELFKDIPYSMEIKEARKKITEKLKIEYEKQLPIKQTDIQTMGYLMEYYGTVEKAAKLAGYTLSEIASWSHEETITYLPKIKKAYRAMTIAAIIASMYSILAIVSLVNLVIAFIPDYIFSSITFTVLAVFGFWWYFNNKKKNDYQHMLFDNESHAYLEEKMNCFKKRTINSYFISIFITSYFLYFTSMVLLYRNMNISEFVQFLILNVVYLEVGAFLCLKNELKLRWLNACLSNNNKQLLIKHRIKVVIGAVGYWVMVLLIMAIFKDKITYYINLYLLFVVIYGVGVLIYNLQIRKKIVKKNIVVNKRRISILIVALLIFVGASVLRMDSWIIQPYIATVAAVEQTPNQINYEEDTGTYTITTNKEDFKILQLTDIHLGGSVFSSIKDLKALDAVYTLINHTNPDLVVVTGDLVFPLGIMSFSFNNNTPIMQFASFMRNIGVPWAFVYGNHDTELVANSSAEQINQLLQTLSYKSSRTLLYPYIQPDIYGRNNQLIELRNADGTLRQALFLLDSNDYTGEGFNDYDYIHDDQVEWYKEEVLKLNEEEGRTVSSLAFFHIPLQQYKTAYDLYEEGSDKITYFFGENNEKMFDKVCASKHPSQLFDTAVELGSTKAMFCGHDHYNNLSVEYEGIRLTYGMSIDYLAMPGIANETSQRGGTLITLSKDESFTIEQIKLTDIKENH